MQKLFFMHFYEHQFACKIYQLSVMFYIKKKIFAVSFLSKKTVLSCQNETLKLKIEFVLFPSSM